VASHYASLAYLTPCERLLFDFYIKPGSAVLDLGVGGGRTTAYLASRAGRYVGVDYAPAMIKTCQARFPGREFVVADAANLSTFASASFDAVVFAFNGMDYVLPDTSRRASLEHIRRILKTNGVLIFSSHNPRAILVPPRWSEERAQSLANKWLRGWPLLRTLLLAAITGMQFLVAVGRSVAATLQRVKRLRSSAFWRGEGEFVDAAHGGLLTHCWIPTRVIDELNCTGFRVQRALGDDYPAKSHDLHTDWYYYVFSKRQTSG
jgi:SAM-dependent methyltransferase